MFREERSRGQRRISRRRPAGFRKEEYGPVCQNMTCRAVFSGYLCFGIQDHRGAVEIAQRDQRQRAVERFIGLHGFFCAAEAGVSIVVEQDHAAFCEPWAEILEAGEDRGVEIGVQADEGVGDAA